MLRKTGKITIVLALILTVVSWRLADRLPPKTEIDPKLFQEPLQESIEMEPFQTEAGQITYTITPLYEYELWGLVVSEHRTTKWYDYYHENWQDYLNLKDLCVLWGNNLANEVYRKMKFSSGSWSCRYRWPNQEIGRQFNQDQGSNNHLLSDSEKVSREILKAKKGDQIHLKGYLAKYSHDQGFQRGTSTTRQDSGNQACETIFVTDFEIIRQNQTIWKLINKLAAGSIFLGLIIWLLPRKKFS